LAPEIVSLKWKKKMYDDDLINYVQEQHYDYQKSIPTEYKPTSSHCDD